MHYGFQCLVKSKSEKTNLQRVTQQTTMTQMLIKASKTHTARLRYPADILCGGGDESFFAARQIG